MDENVAVGCLRIRCIISAWEKDFGLSIWELYQTKDLTILAQARRKSKIMEYKEGHSDKKYAYNRMGLNTRLGTLRPFFVLQQEKWHVQSATQ